jgi:transposase
VIHLFNEKGLAALDPQWAGGRPRLVSDEDSEFIIAAATTRPAALGQPFTHWSLRKLAAARPPGHAEHWSGWKRRHQALARWYHQRTRLATENPVIAQVS